MVVERTSEQVKIMAKEIRERLTQLNKLMGDQDDCLLAITKGVKPPEDALRALPPWRAVMIARVAEKAGLMTIEEVDELVKEAAAVGGAGRLVAKNISTEEDLANNQYRVSFEQEDIDPVQKRFERYLRGE